MSQTNEMVARFLEESLSTVVQSVMSGRAASGKMRFTDPNGGAFSFWWIEVCKLDGDRLFACTSDGPPTFHITVSSSDAGDLVQATTTFLKEQFASAQRLEILLSGTGSAGHPALPTCVGNSDDGFGNITEQVIYDVF